jgi:hypothetical protein
VSCTTDNSLSKRRRPSETLESRLSRLLVEGLFRSSTIFGSGRLVSRASRRPMFSDRGLNLLRYAVLRSGRPAWRKKWLVHFPGEWFVLQTSETHAGSASQGGGEMVRVTYRRFNRALPSATSTTSFGCQHILRALELFHLVSIHKFDDWLLV